LAGAVKVNLAIAISGGADLKRRSGAVCDDDCSIRRQQAAASVISRRWRKAERSFDFNRHAPRGPPKLLPVRPADESELGRIPGLVRLADVSPTILSLAEIQTSPGEFGSLVSEPLLRGTDLSTEMKSDEELTLPARVALGELLGEKPISSIRTESAKLIVELASGKPLEMYDLSTDPSEQDNLVSQDSAAVAALLDAWESLSAELESVSQQIEPKELDDEIRTRLKSLGYIQ